MNYAIDKDVNNFNKGFLTTKQGGQEDPTYLGFRLVFDFDPTYRDLNTGLTNNALFAEPSSDLESAQRYLRSIGYPKRADMLREFKNNLRYINDKTPWFFQTVDGLGDVWKIETGENFNNFRGKDKILKFTCLESIDLRITALADLYRKATFDPQTMRSLLPENLRWFTMTVQLAEMRTFHTLKKAAANVSVSQAQNIQNANLGQVGVPADNRASFELIDGLISILEFRFSQCEFDFSESFPIDGPVSNGQEMMMAKQSFKVKVRRIEERNEYRLLELLLGEGPNENQFKPASGSLSSTGAVTDPDAVNPVMSDKDAAFNRRVPNNPILNSVNGQLSDIRRQLENIGANSAARLTNQINSAVQSKVLGNVYDLRNQSLETIINQFTGRPQQPINRLGAEDIYPNNPGSDQTTGTSDNLGNVYK